MNLMLLPEAFSVCKIENMSEVNIKETFVFVSKTDEELSLTCPTRLVPSSTLEREDGWRGFRIEGQLDFSLIGILYKILKVLAENQIGVYVISTYNTDYVFIKAQQLEQTKTVLEQNGYSFVN